MTISTPRRALLDTSVVIDFPAVTVARYADEVAVSAITVGELEYGAAASPDPTEQLSRRLRVRAVREQFDVLPFDAAVAEYYGALANLVWLHGRNPRRMDLQIAATAARHGLPLLTRNAADFLGLGTAVTVVDLLG